jgi:hypothetical protein
MAKRLRPALAATVVAGLTAAATIGTGAATDPKQALACVQPLDVAGIDAVLTAAGSPLAGQGGAFVNSAAAVGLDPRALIAIAGHETILQTYLPAQPIHNAFGIGPGRAFESDAAAIAYAADLLARHYVGEGRDTLSKISSKWAPLGVSNDPNNLNANWVAGVGTLYTRLGGNPEAPITLGAQTQTTCQAAPAPAAPPPPTGTPAPGIVAWNGSSVPVVTEALMERGADPNTGAPATRSDFVFPLIPAATPIRYADDFTEAGLPGCFGKPQKCAVTLNADPGTGVASAVAGTLTAASAAEQAGGMAFWIVTADGDRVGYSGLAGYAAGIGEGVAVAAGQLLGTSTKETTFAWERGGQRINPFPMLAVTRASDA